MKNINLTEKRKKASEAVEATPAYKALEEAYKALEEAEKALRATPEYKVYDKKEEAYWGAWETKKAKEEANKARREAWKAVKKTPECKDWGKAWDVYDEAIKTVMATPEYKAAEEASEAYWNLTGIKEFRPIRRKNNEKY